MASPSRDNALDHVVVLATIFLLLAPAAPDPGTATRPGVRQP